MGRTNTLRLIQLKETAKWAFFGTVGIVLVGLILIMMVNRTGEILSIQNLIFGVMSILSTFIYLLTFIIPITDGTSDFDTALRFGVSRNGYFLFNIFLYTIVAVLHTYFSNINGNNGQMNVENSTLTMTSNALTQMTWQGILINLITMLGIALLSYAFYRFGWKVLLCLFAINVLFGLLIGLGVLAFGDNMFSVLSFFQGVVHFIEQFGTLFKAMGVVLIIALYYWTIQKMPVK